MLLSILFCFCMYPFFLLASLLLLLVLLLLTSLQCWHAAVTVVLAVDDVPMLLACKLLLVCPLLLSCLPANVTCLRCCWMPAVAECLLLLDACCCSILAVLWVPAVDGIFVVVKIDYRYNYHSVCIALHCAMCIVHAWCMYVLVVHIGTTHKCLHLHLNSYTYVSLV